MSDWFKFLTIVLSLLIIWLSFNYYSWLCNSDECKIENIKLEKMKLQNQIDKNNEMTNIRNKQIESCIKLWKHFIYEWYNYWTNWNIICQ